MSDPIDQAQLNQLNQVQRTPKDYSVVSLKVCDECENEIPLERQRYGAITLCIECKNKQEQQAKRYF
ncbi:TraR/DksA C4-type zinc finger protein [Acinetobacter sp. ULE_I010]|uniref:TraR/DksA C4-type zinc finger protein n=1 Tax=Acinetobacter sp. ULE_I010 TaxID=3373065 RepID=UPI003AF916CC